MSEFLRNYGLLILGFMMGLAFKFTWMAHSGETIEVRVRVNGEEDLE